MVDKASTKYNDFVGTAAADGIDFHHSLILEKHLEDNGVDTSRYTPVGFSLFSGQSDYCYFDIICIDKIQKKTVNINFEKQRKITDILNMFKQFHVVVYKDVHPGYYLEESTV